MSRALYLILRLQSVIPRTSNYQATFKNLSKDPLSKNSVRIIMGLPTKILIIKFMIKRKNSFIHIARS